MKKLYATTDNFNNIIHTDILDDRHKEFLIKSLFDAIEHYEKERKKALHNIPKYVQAVHRHIDSEREAMRKVEKPKLTCRKGCSFCCMLNVDITMDEAELLLKKNPNIDWNKVQLQSNYDSSTWSQLSYENRRCVFLSDAGECTTYDSRPAPCRNQLSVSDPEDCDTEKNPGKLILKFNSWKAELISSAAMNLCESGSMAQMLLKCKLLKQL